MTGADEGADLGRLDAYLCELKEAQIRDGLHVFGVAPEGRLARDLALALARVPRGAGAGGDASLLRALAADFGWTSIRWTATAASPWKGARPAALAGLTDDAWRSAGDSVERLELSRPRLLDGEAEAPGAGERGGAGAAARRPRPGHRRLRPGGGDGASHRPGRAVRRPWPVGRAHAGAARTCCRPDATSTASTPAPCPPPPPGRLGGNRRAF